MTSLSRYRKIYSLLLRLYPEKHRERYAEQMEQTFSDMLRDRAAKGRDILGYAIWLFAETSLQIIKTNLQSAVMKNKRMVRIIIAIIGLLLIPFIAMQFTDEMNWSVNDFIAMGFMLTVAGAMIEIGARISRNTQYRVGLAVAVFAGFTLLWVNLAVGIIGSENNQANWLFVGVLAVGIVGVIVSAFEASGMAVAALVTACAQFLAPIIAFVIWKKTIEPGEGPGVAGIFLLNFFWVLLWLISARLFRNAACGKAAPALPSS
jgi:hypothetical protein